MNRSAKDREWSSLHYGGEGVLVTLYRTKVFADDLGEEDHCCYPGRTPAVPCKKRISNPISESEMGSEASGVVGQLNSTISLVKAKLPAKASGVWMGKATGKNG